MSMLRTDRNQTFDSQGNLLSEEVVEVDITAEVVEYDLHDKARQALATNADFLDLTAPTNAQTLQQVRALTRQMSGLTRLILREFSE